MEHSDERQLAVRIDRELRRLPLPKAPPTLAPRVLAAIAARAHLPWWKKSWTHWPFGLRALFLGFLVAATAGLLYAGSQFAPGESLAAAAERVGDYFSLLTPVWQLLSALGIAFASMLRSGGQVLLWSVIATATVMYLTCVGLGTVFYRVAMNKV